jgi:hypothetical protein
MLGHEIWNGRRGKENFADESLEEKIRSDIAGSHLTASGSQKSENPLTPLAGSSTMGGNFRSKS